MNFAHWKTTVNGFLGFFIATGAVLTAIPSPFIDPKVSAGITIALALARAWVGVLQKDAGTQDAVVPGAGIQQVPAHEIPDAKDAKAVINPKP